MPFPQLPSRFRLILRFTVIAAAVGAVYSEMHVAEARASWFAVFGVPRGLMTGAVIAGILSSLQVFILTGPLGAPYRSAPFPVHVAIKTGIYLVVILFGLALGAWVFPAPDEPGIERRDVLFSLAIAFVFAFMYEVNSLLGQNVLTNFITGRYHKPRLESRVFLFLDMEGSTGSAERLGPLAFHRLLNRFVLDLTEPIVAAHGEIHSYVGDELIATWKLEEGRAPARCIAACFAAIDRLAECAPDYAQEFGAAVNVRAGTPLRPRGDRRNGLGEEGDRVPRRHRQHDGPNPGTLSADRRSRARFGRPHRSPGAAARRRQALARRSQAARQRRRPLALRADQGAGQSSRRFRPPRDCAGG